MEHAYRQYQEWLESPLFDEATKLELLAIKDQPEEIKDRFYNDLSFGTGGLRGVLGAGTNRINRYTVREPLRDWRTIFCSSQNRLQKAWQSHTIPAVCQKNLPWKPLCV